MGWKTHLWKAGINDKLPLVVSLKQVLELAR
jgi:hypothetical protein